MLHNHSKFNNNYYHQTWIKIKSPYWHFIFFLILLNIYVLHDSQVHTEKYITGNVFENKFEQVDTVEFYISVHIASNVCMIDVHNFINMYLFTKCSTIIMSSWWSFGIFHVVLIIYYTCIAILCSARNQEMGLHC